MNRIVSAFLLVAVLAGLLAALGLGLEVRGYSFGAVGVARLDGLASAATFIPMAALYAFAAALMMILPLRPAGFVHANAASPLHLGTIVLMATIVGVQAARFAFGDRGALWILADWQFLFAFAIAGGHLVMSELRRNLLLRTLAFVAFTAATLACLYWSFKI